ncbi:hypothetical protein Esi_0226_0020 [Ectocarpus siliculosus]|uniref:CCDC43 PWI-like domain-containing protein n=1 Tax=Ectocarpus siliculosus TaxID=2880 RepID=D7FS05_ECTSI|nr:hypothetical protein Esi_0226_0020 [Ectocarpus siliculosus]|eukprot:CBJ30946.1 hypothetical protein Esi_0226_0020 [Ectocarpus siliculosus]
MAEGGGDSSFDTWLVDKLDALGLDAEVYGGYVTGIMGDEDNPQEERIESVIEILSGAAEEDNDLGEFRSALNERWDMKVEHEEKEKEAAKAAKQKEMDSKKEEERRQVEEADKARRAKADKRVQRSAEEQAERARLLGEYGYDSDPVDEEGNPLPPEEGGDGEGGSSAGDSLGEAYGKNLNKERVREEVAAKREAIKKTHHATALQNKIALEADKMRKEMAKNARKTTKGERKR